MKKTILNISGMGCSGCVNSVESALMDLDGVEAASVKLEDGMAEVSFDETKLQLSDFEKAVEDAGFTVAGVRS